MMRKRTGTAVLLMLGVMLTMAACGGTKKAAEPTAAETSAVNDASAAESAVSVESEAFAESEVSAESEASAESEVSAESAVSVESAAAAVRTVPGSGNSAMVVDTTYDTAPPVLVNPAGFSGTTPLETDNDYHGGYYYSERTEDTLTNIINCCVANAMQEGEDILTYGESWANLISPYGVREFTMVAVDDYGENLRGCNAYELTWVSGQNEETRKWNTLFFMTDTHTYMYAFDTAIDFEEEMRGTWYDAFSGLELMDVR